jgi:hypothetical protein
MAKPVLGNLPWGQSGSVAGSSLNGEQIARVWDLSDGRDGEGGHAH